MIHASISSGHSSTSVRTGNRLRLILLAAALAVSSVPVYRFIGSMLWYHEYLGDYQVFWGVTKLPIQEIYGHRAFAYPPSSLVLLLPFGLLPFWPSLVAWSAAGSSA